MCSHWPPRHFLFSQPPLLVLYNCQSPVWKWPCLIPRGQTRAGLRVSSVVLWRRTWIWPPDLGRPQNHLLSSSFDNSPFSGTFVNLSGIIIFGGQTWLGVTMGNVRTLEGGWIVGRGGLEWSKSSCASSSDRSAVPGQDHDWAPGFCSFQQICPLEVSPFNGSVVPCFFAADRGQNRQNGSNWQY